MRISDWSSDVCSSDLEYSNPRRDVPFAMLMMIASVTLLYFAVQWVALGTLPGLAQSQTPLADAAATFGGGWLALVLTVGAAVSILGTNSNTVMLGQIGRAHV